MTTKMTRPGTITAEFLVLILLIAAFILSSEFMVPRVTAKPKTIYVNVANFDDPYEDGSLDHPFNTIQEGIDASDPGDVIFVAAGMYNEYVQITKSSISLIGQDGAVIDGGGVRNGIRVGALPPNYAENVSISGFTIQNCVKGVTLVRCRYACFRNVNIINNTYGFSDHSLQVNDIDTSNTVNGKPIYYWVKEHDKQVPTDAGYVVLVNCTNIIVKNLNLTGNGQGIVLKYTSNSVIENVNISNNWDGMYIDAWSNNNTIVNSKITNNSFIGIYISKSRENTIINTSISKNGYGVFMDEFSNTNIFMDNTITENMWGLYLFGENGKISENVINANTISNNNVGISLLYSEDNIIYHNNFINNSDQAHASNSINTWDYNGEGNYWSDYTGEDLNNDGVGDTPYIVNEDNVDNYPLKGLFSLFCVTWQGQAYYISVISNSTIFEFCFIQPEKMISLNVTAPNSASTFFKLSLPIILLGGPYTILIGDSSPVGFNEKSNGTHSFLYFTYEFDMHSVKIKGTTVISEFSSSLLLLLFAVLFAITLLNKLIAASASSKKGL